MYVYIAIAIAFSLPLFLVWGGINKSAAWIASVAVVPAFVLLAEFVLPYAGGGASMWPIALVVGGVVGGAVGGLGTWIGGALRRGQGHDA